MQVRGYLRGLGAGLFISAVLMGIATPKANDTLSDEEIKSRAAQLGMVEENNVLVKPAVVQETGDKTGEINVTPTVDKEGTADEGNDGLNKTEEKTDTEKNTGTADRTDNKTETGTADRTDIKSDTGAAVKTDDKSKEDTADEEYDEDGNVIDAPKEKGTANEDLAMGGLADVSDKPEIEVSKSEESKGNEKSSEVSERTGGEFTLQIKSGASSYDVAKLLAKGGAVENANDFDRYLCDNNYDHHINHGTFKIPEGADYEQIARIITGRK